MSDSAAPPPPPDGAMEALAVSAVPAALEAKCKAAGEAVAAAKKGGAAPDVVKAAVDALLAAKKEITALDPDHAMAIVDKKKKKKAAAAPAGGAPADGKLSKKAQKRLAEGRDAAPKKDKDPNRWAVDPEKAKKKAEEKAAKALAKAAAAAEDDAASRAPPTPPGERKVLAAALAKTYNPADVESAWQEWWEASGWYGCDAAAAAERPRDERFVMVIPPPNVTGSLHLGHALTAAIEDCLTRWHRMRGHATLYVPGTDHAGIATQSVVEKQLAKRSPPVSRRDLGRDKFLDEVWKWKGEYGGKICNQLRRLGSSVDWSRERFTMDDRCAAAVTEAFVRFNEAGVLYRASRLVNWSCALKSAISDLEVDHVELGGGEWRTCPNHEAGKKYQFGMMTEFAYKVLDDAGDETAEEVVVATTRLETMLGDSAVAVHPDDARYAHLHGKRLRHPFFPKRVVAVITDGILVDMAKGTGCVKVTPAHDPNDYECGKRHGLPFMTIFTLDGRVAAEATGFPVGDNAEAGADYETEAFPEWVAGAMRYDARVIIEEKLDAAGLLRGKSTRPMNLAVCSRSGDIIEPLVQPQWYVDCSDMARRACDAVRDGSLKIRPAMHEKTWFQWLENIRPWCVSRQLWWGHRIPAWFAFHKGEDRGLVDMNAEKNKKRWIVARDEAAATAKAVEVLGTADVELQRDEDVLDTWFSSGLFPFSVMGWPEDTDEFRAFYPTNLLETGLDILFFWVARMVMMGLQLTDTLPFTDVYLHAMVRDKEGRKMSKSLGNVIDPLEVIDGCELEDLVAKLKGGNLKDVEVAKAEKAFREDFPDGMPRCGTDALRVGLLAYTVQGRDINLDIKRVVGYRSFCNKLWNAVRFMLGCFDGYEAPETLWGDLEARRAGLAGRDAFVLSRLAATVARVDECMRGFLFGDCVQAIYAFFLNDLCDVYVELVKPVVYDASEGEGAKLAAKMTLWACLDAGLRLLHPLCPFVTEELWQRLPRSFSVSSIMIAPYPLPADVARFEDAAAEAGTALVLEACAAARSLRAQYALANKPAAFYVAVGGDAARGAALEERSSDFATLAKAASVTVLVGDKPPAGCGMKLVDETLAVSVDLKGLVDVDAEIKKLEKELKGLEPLVAKLLAKQADEKYAAKAPPKQKQQDAEKLASYQDKAKAATDAVAAWKAMK